MYDQLATVTSKRPMSEIDVADASAKSIIGKQQDTYERENKK